LPGVDGCGGFAMHPFSPTISDPLVILDFGFWILDFGDALQATICVWADCARSSTNRDQSSYQILNFEF
jgi:hypothetical protein